MENVFAALAADFYLNWVAKIAAVVLYDTKLSNPIATTQKPLEGVQTLLTSNTGHRPLFTRD